MEINDWLMIAVAVAGTALGLSGLRSGVLGLRRREYWGAGLFLLLGSGFILASLYTVWMVASGGTANV